MPDARADVEKKMAGSSVEGPEGPEHEARSERRFVLRPLDGGSDELGGPPPAPPAGDVPVPPGLSRLIRETRGREGRNIGRLVPATIAGGSDRSTSPVEGEGGCLLEPLGRGGQAVLLVLAEAGAPVRVNGHWTTRTAGLRPGDLVEPGDGGPAMRIVLDAVVEIGRPPAACLDGRSCPICLQPFAETDLVWLCAACGAVVHVEDSRPTDPSRCLDLCSECPICGEPVVGRDPLVDPEGGP